MHTSSSTILVVLALAATACTAGSDEASAAAAPSDGVAASPDEAPRAPGCTHDCGGPSASKPTPPAAPPKVAGPTWLAQAWRRSYHSAGDSISERWTLQPDGTGELSVSTVRPNIPYGAGDGVEKVNIHWSATDSVIDLLSSAPEPYTATPNCRLLAIGGVTLEGGSNKDCPFKVPTLTAEETALVGHWEFYLGGNGGWSGTWADVYFQSDRDIVMNYHASTFFTDEDTQSFEAHDYFTLGADSVLHGVSPGGTEELHFQLTLANGTLTLCNGGCIDLTKK